jgi:hypothetical protein
VVVFLSTARLLSFLRDMETEMRYACDVKGGIHVQYGNSLGSIGPYLNDQRTRRSAQNLAKKGEYAFRKVLEVLIGAAPGGVATYVYPEIAASVELGGARPIVNTNLVNRATTAADVTDLKNALTTLSGLTFTPAPVYNGDRNPLGTR